MLLRMVCFSMDSYNWYNERYRKQKAAKDGDQHRELNEAVDESETTELMLTASSSER